MLLIVTSRDDVTADLVGEQLTILGHEFIRFDTESFPETSKLTVTVNQDGSSAILSTSGKAVDIADIETVWFRKPTPPKISSDVVDPQARTFAQQECETVISSLYRQLYFAFWISRPDAIRRANDKIYQLTLARKLGFIVPRTLVTNDTDTAREFVLSTPTPKIIKPLKAGLVEYPDGHIELIYTSLITPDDIANIHQVAFAPCLFQDYVPKECEIRATVIGRRMFAVTLDTQTSDISRHDWRRENCRAVRYCQTTLPETLVHRCFEFMDHYDLQFSAFDFIKTPSGDYVFLENNPNGQWAWLDLEIGNGMIKYMAEFLAREA